MFRDVAKIIMAENKLNVNGAEESKQLTDEEINKIIEEKYSDKDDRTKNFIFKSIKKHGIKYTYYNSNIIEGDPFVTVTCPIHGDFIVRYRYFYRSCGTGCKKCSFDGFRLSMETLKERMKNMFPQYEIVDGQEYVNNGTKLRIHCNKHNCDFEITPGNLLYGKTGCKECYLERRRESRRATSEKLFIDYFNNNCGDYCELIYNGEGNIGYVDQITRVSIKCKECGAIFQMSPDEVKRKVKLGWKNICTFCKGGSHSFAEKCVNEWLVSHNINFLTEVRHNVNEIHGGTEALLVKIDFQLNYNGINYWVEPAGSQHYKFSNYFQKSYIFIIR